MKKIFLCAVALGAMMMAACGNKTNGNDNAQDSDTVSFEQSQIEQKMMAELDSLAQAGEKLKPVDGVFLNGKIQLSENEKKAKPTYLLDVEGLNKLSTLSQKYRALGMIGVDRAIAKIYGMDIAPYDKAILKLSAEVSDPAFQKDMKFDTTKVKTLYDKEKAAGRLNYVWESSVALNIETLYVLSQNIDKFVAAFDDESAANITYHLQLLKLGLDDLSNYDPNIKKLDEALEPLNELNAMNVAQLKEQLTKMKPQVEAIREGLLK